MPATALASHVAPVTPSFDSPQLPPVTIADDPTEAAAGDFDGDGNPDAVTNSTTANLSVLIGNGNGAFAPATSRMLGVPADNLAEGDFNGDGRGDVAAFGDNGVNPNQLSILLGSPTGLGNPGAPIPIPGGIAAGLAAGPLDADADLDLVALTRGSTEQAVPLLGDGAGGFSAGTSQLSTCPVGAQAPVDLDLGDLTGDGDVDAAVACTAGSGAVTVMPGDGSGSLGPATVNSITPAITNPSEVHLARFDGDDDLDAVVGDAAGIDNVFDLMLNDGSGSFVAANGGQPFDAAGNGGSLPGIKVGDVNGDEHPDLIAASPGGGSHDVVVALGNGAGSFTPNVAGKFGIAFDLNTAAFGNSLGPADVALADFNLDQRLDFGVAAAGHAAGLDRLVSMRNTSVPSAMTGGATGIGQTTAQIQGFVRPGGTATNYFFEYGTSTAYGSTTPLGAVAPSGGQTVAESLGGLQQGTTYHYRLRAENVNGTWFGSNRTFTTAAPPGPAGSAALAPPSTSGRPAISFSKPRHGKRQRRSLVCDAGRWSGSPSFAFAWLKNGTLIRGASANTYRLRKKDVGDAIQCQVTASNGGGSNTKESAPVVVGRFKKNR